MQLWNVPLIHVPLTVQDNERPEPSTAENLLIHEALKAAFISLRVVERVDSPHRGENREVWRIWARQAAQAGELMQSMPLVHYGSAASGRPEPVACSESTPAAYGPAPHPGNFVSRLLEGLALSEAFRHYDNDDMGLEERFYFLWELCRRAEVCHRTDNAVPVGAIRSLRRHLTRLAGEIETFYGFRTADEALRDAARRKAVWLTEVGIDPERLIQHLK
ncbi:MAG: hypothetical protein Kow0059_04100 [Candidatus Sumerlaeia bacterium]